MKEIYYNAKVYTGSETLCDAFLVENELIQAVGSDKEILALAGTGTVCYNMKGAFITPGFNDSHMHLLGLGQSLGAAQLARHTDSLAGMIAYVRGFAKENPPREGRFLLGRGWNQDYFTDVSRMPSRVDLDTISRDFPIMLTRACGHCCVVNSRVLEMAGITGDSVSPEGGRIGMENGEPDGRFYDNAMPLVTKLIPAPDKEELKHFIRLACRALNRYGITSSQTDDYSTFRSVPFEVINEAYRELEETGELTVRVYEQANFTSLQALKTFAEKRHVMGAREDRFKLGPLKMLGDGSLGSRTAHLSKPYADDPSTSGFSLFSAEEMNEMVAYAHNHGMQVAIHAIGDQCLDQVLDAIELAVKANPRKDHRHGVVHCQISRKDQLERIRDLQLHIYAQSIFLDYDNHIVESRVGKELASTSYSWKTLKDWGVSVSNGSDAPVELPDVMRGIECAVTRTSLDGTGPYLPEEAFTVKEALDSFTIRGAEASFEEHIKGRIAPGYLADFTVLGADPFTADPKTLHTIPVLACYLSGQCVMDEREEVELG